MRLSFVVSLLLTCVTAFAQPQRRAALDVKLDAEEMKYLEECYKPHVPMEYR